ncbi:hypothetical protein HDZ31DRAFT_85187 [Schizophyllum fasciatum]
MSTSTNPRNQMYNQAPPKMLQALFLRPHLWQECTVPNHKYLFKNLYTPEFLDASRRLGQAWKGTVPAGEPTPVYPSIYSYNHEDLRIPKNTPIPPGIPSRAFGGTVQHMMWSEDMVNIALKAEFGDVYQGSDILGGNPLPSDPSVRDIPIPTRAYYIRLWTGRMDALRMVCWQLINIKSGTPQHRPQRLKVYDVTDPSKPLPLLSIEETFQLEKRDGQKPNVCDTFTASDGTVVDFVYNKRVLLRLRLPIRPTSGPPVVREYMEHEILPIDDEQSHEEVEVLDESEDEENVWRAVPGDAEESDSDAD